MREPQPEVVAAARRGDRAAFEELVRAYQGPVYRFVLHLVRDRQVAEDATQEAFVHAFRALARFRGESTFTTWLYRIARNAAVDAVRRAAHQRRLAERVQPPAAAPDPSARVALGQAIEALPATLREAFVLIEVLGLTYREAAVVLSVPAGTLKSRMHRTRSLLIEALSTDEAADEM